MEFSEEKIKDLKQKHGELFLLQVEDKSAVLKHPTRQVLSMASAHASKDPMRFNDILLKNCWVDGDEEIKSDDRYFLGAASKIAELIEVKEATLVKL